MTDPIADFLLRTEYAESDAVTPGAMAWQEIDAVAQDIGWQHTPDDEDWCEDRGEPSGECKVCKLLKGLSQAMSERDELARDLPEARRLLRDAQERIARLGAVAKEMATLLEDDLRDMHAHECLGRFEDCTRHEGGLISPVLARYRVALEAQEVRS